MTVRMEIFWRDDYKIIPRSGSVLHVMCVKAVFNTMASSLNSQAVDADHKIWAISHVDNKSRN